MPPVVLNYHELKMLYQSTYLSVKYISTENGFWRFDPMFLRISHMKTIKLSQYIGEYSLERSLINVENFTRRSLSKLMMI